MGEPLLFGVVGSQVVVLLLLAWREHHNKKLWEKHRKDFIQNRFSELNKTIGDIDSQHLEIEIIESHLFDEEETYNLVEELLIEHLEHIKGEYGEGLVKKTKDNYNMSELMKALEDDLLMNELFGDN